MEWIDPRLDDDARALQFPHSDSACVSGIDAAMKLGELGEDELLAQLFPRLNRNARVAWSRGRLRGGAI